MIANPRQFYFYTFVLPFLVKREETDGHSWFWTENKHSQSCFCKFECGGKVPGISHT